MLILVNLNLASRVRYRTYTFWLEKSFQCSLLTIQFEKVFLSKQTLEFSFYEELNLTVKAKGKYQ